MATNVETQRTDWMELPADTHTGAVRLRSADLDRALRFYRDTLGYRVEERESGVVALTPGPDEPAHFVLEEQLGARRYPRTAGLFHAAIRMPSRRDLARVLRRLVEAEWPIGGASDHGVSEALYLDDAEGNGIEIYADRPRSLWPRTGDQVEMTTVALDIPDLLAQLDGAAPWSGIPAGTDIGHVHLQVGDLARSEAFYAGLLGFTVMQRTYPGALFVAAGGYHHHLGLNTWAGRNVPPAPAEAIGLISYQLVVPDESTRQRLAERLRKAGAAVAMRGAGLLVHDPDQIGVELVVEEREARGTD